MSKLPLTFWVHFSDNEYARRMMMCDMAANGAEHICLSEGMINKIISDPPVADKLLKEVAECNLSYVDSHAPFGNSLDLNNPYPEDFAILALRHQMHIKIAAYMNVDTITMHVGNNQFCPEIPLNKHIERMERLLDAILPEAEKNKVIVALENCWTPTNTPDVLVHLVEKFSTEYLGLCYDSGHANIMDHGRYHGEGNATWYWRNAGMEMMPAWEDAALEKMLPHIVNCHLHDNTGMGDRHDLPGTGNLDWDKIVRLLKTAPRLRVIQSEVAYTRYGMSMKTLVEKFKTLFA